MATLTTCKTYPSDTVFIQKITMTEKKSAAIDPNAIDGQAEEINFVRTKINPNERSVIRFSKLPVSNANVKQADDHSAVADDNEIKLTSVSLNENANANVNDPIKPIELDSNANAASQQTSGTKIPVPSDLKRDNTYDGCPVFRVITDFSYLDEQIINLMHFNLFSFSVYLRIY